MIAQLTGTVVDASQPGAVVLDVRGVGYELGVSRTTAADLPAPGTPGATLLPRLRVSENAVALFGFSTREERAVFDRLVQIPKVGPALALKILSSFTPRQLAEVVACQDVGRMTAVPGVGKKSAPRLLLDLAQAFSKDPELKAIASAATPLDLVGAGPAPTGGPSVVEEATAALPAMGLTPQEAEVVFEGLPDDATVEQAVRYALKRIGGRP